MRQDLYAALRERIVKHVPEIMEPKLRSGHKCLVSKNGERFVTSYDVAIHDSELEVLQEVGRDIQLADVLRAIDRLRSTMRPLGNREFVTFGDGLGDNCQDWNLALPLHEQSDELGQFLLTVIE